MQKILVRFYWACKAFKLLTVNLSFYCEALKLLDEIQKKNFAKIINGCYNDQLKASRIHAQLLILSDRQQIIPW